MIRFALVLLIWLPMAAAADWSPDPESELEQQVADALASFRNEIPGIETYFEKAHGFTIFPSVVGVGLGFGGAYGKGIVVEGDRTIGKTRFRQITSGIQAGARSFSMILFFRDEQALEYYRAAKIQFLGQAGLAAATAGIAATPSYNGGVALMTLPRFGLMGEFTVSGAKFGFTPTPFQQAERDFSAPDCACRPVSGAGRRCW
jgi:lipid-binding SYLF domain-containing protein